MQLYGVKLEFDDGLGEDARAMTIAEIRRRMEELDVGPIYLLTLSDQWPYCRGEPGCQTVADSMGVD